LTTLQIESKGAHNGLQARPLNSALKNRGPAAISSSPPGHGFFVKPLADSTQS
jgi:hypothetical protein